VSPHGLAAAALRRLDPERAHRLALAALKADLGPRNGPDDPILATEVAGLRLPNPIGLAAGFDKNGEVPDAMLAAGFGWVEVGTVTPLPQPGNPRPRLHRLPEDRAVVNRLGFNNGGHDALAARLSGRSRRGIVGVNVGANRDSADRVADYVAGVARFAPLADYLTVNVSSPNTPGLRDLQSRDALAELLTRCREALAISSSPEGSEGEVAAKRTEGPLGAAEGNAVATPRLFLKVAPDLSDTQIADIAETVATHAVAGLIVSNTTVERPATLRSAHARETGGLSGAPLFARSTAVLAAFRSALPARIALIGVGGVGSGDDAYGKLRAGASAVQLYTALIYEGPGLVRRIKRDLASRLRAEGHQSIAEAVGR